MRVGHRDRKAHRARKAPLAVAATEPVLRGRKVRKDRWDQQVQPGRQEHQDQVAIMCGCSKKLIFLLPAHQAASVVSS